MIPTLFPTRLMLLATWLIVGLGVFGSLLWLTHLAHLILYRDRIRFLADVPPIEPVAGWPSLTIVIAARDEADSIAAAVRSLLAQDYPTWELVVVDDRSTDATGSILRELAQKDRRLRVVSIRSLPAGWLGKTHALQRGIDEASGKWTLFTDADVLFAAGTLRRTLAYAVAERADHVAAIPEVTSTWWSERVFLALFGLMFSMYARPGKIARFGSRAHAGVGAFNLVRTEALAAIGGFARLRLSVDDDIRLGQALKYAGYAARFVIGRGLIEVRWQVGLSGMIRGVEKNFFGGLGYNLPRVAAVVVVLIALGIAPFIGLVVGPLSTRFVCAVGVASVATLLGMTRRGSGIGEIFAATMPLATVAVLVALIRSTALTLLRGGVVWRSHLYPLGELRAHVRDRDAWTREVWRSTR